MRKKTGLTYPTCVLILFNYEISIICRVQYYFFGYKNRTFTVQKNEEEKDQSVFFSFTIFLLKRNVLIIQNNIEDSVLIQNRFCLQNSHP